MKIITAIGNEEINKKMKENKMEIIGKDIQYMEAVIEVIEKNPSVELLILSSILPGDLNIYEFINIIKYNNPKLEIIIILEKENQEMKQFMISKGINNFYYNNKNTINEIIEKIKIIENKSDKKYQEEKIKIIKQKNKKIINIIIKIKNKIIKKIKKIIINKKIISIIGPPQVGKTIFSLLLSLNFKNKKILIINLNKKNDIEVIIGKKIKNKTINWRKNIDIVQGQNNKSNTEKIFIKNQKEEQLNKNYEKYDYIIIDSNNLLEEKEIVEKINCFVLLVEANLLGINKTRYILEELINKQKIQKDNIKIVFNKHTKTSINTFLLKKIFIDFDIIGYVHYDKYYNFLINNNFKLLIKKINNKYSKIIKKIK